MSPATSAPTVIDARRALARRALRWLAPGLTLAALLALGAARPAPAQASAADYCSGEQLAVGANWTVCWEIRANEGLAITHAYFTKPGVDRRVMGDGTVAQIFVPYETGQPRYHDVAYGLGAAMVTLSPTVDCPNGTLLAGGKVCREIHDRGIAEKICTGTCTTRRGEALALWGSSQMGAYNYITKWEFHDDGSIHPHMGLTGALQFGDTAHLHNVYWRLDLDIDDPDNDSPEEFYRITPGYGDGSTGVMGWNPLLGETYRPNRVEDFRKWRIVDTQGLNAAGMRRSYELIPHIGDGNYRGTLAEGFTRGEFWVTRYKPGERFVSTETEDLLTTYLNGESVTGEDLVVWYVAHEHHEVRDEDAPYMPSEWIHFQVRPRDFFDETPLD